MKSNTKFRNNLLLLLLGWTSITVMAQDIKVKQEMNPISPKSYNFIIANDLGRNGYLEQKPIAAQMGEWAGKAHIKFVAAAGDIHHFNGVASVNDPLWMTNYELIYSNPELMLDWYPILGNHEYRGNTQACLDYSKISRRWVMPSRYYTMVKKVNDSTTMRLLFIDTTPLIQKYRNGKDEYPDAWKQDDKAQIHFIDSVLAVSKETWKVVIGHHPVYAATEKSDNERLDIQATIDPLLRKYKVDFYFCGHIHSFQHIKKSDSPVDYIVNSSASGARPVQKIEGTQFCSSDAGFAICSVTNSFFKTALINAKGEVIYSYQKEKLPNSRTK
jgi:hypothetical protein